MAASGRRGEHGIYVDHNDYVYIAGNGNGTGELPVEPPITARTLTC